MHGDEYNWRHYNRPNTHKIWNAKIDKANFLSINYSKGSKQLLYKTLDKLSAKRTYEARWTNDESNNNGAKVQVGKFGKRRVLRLWFAGDSSGEL